MKNLIIFSTALLLFLSNLVCYAQQKEKAVFKLTPLTYTNDALEPFISKETIDFHYGKHLNGYVKNLNKLIAGTKYEKMSLTDIVKSSKGAIFNNAAQIFNHEFYFQTFSKMPQKAPSMDLLKAINKQWGSYDTFKAEFTNRALKIFGSGWLWLVKNKDGSLSIVATSNAETPITEGKTPLMVFDVWEHAYYIDYRNNRAKHLENIWNVIDWKVVEKRYKK